MGEIVVYNVKDKDIPIVHRIVRKFGTGEKAKLLTKGDNNAADDTELCMRFPRLGSRICRRNKLTVDCRRPGTGLLGEGGHHRQCCSLHTVRRLRHDHALRAPMDEDGHAGRHGSAGCAATRIETARFEMAREEYVQYPKKKGRYAGYSNEEAISRLSIAVFR